MPRPLQTVSQSDSLIQIVDINSHTKWQTVQIQISWLLQKPTDLDLHCLQRQGISGFSRTRVNNLCISDIISYIPKKSNKQLDKNVDPNQRPQNVNSNLGLHYLPLIITKTCLYNFDPLKPHFYIVKLGFTGYTLFFFFLLKT